MYLEDITKNAEQLSEEAIDSLIDKDDLRRVIKDVISAEFPDISSQNKDKLLSDFFYKINPDLLDAHSILFMHEKIRAAKRNFYCQQMLKIKIEKIMSVEALLLLKIHPFMEKVLLAMYTSKHTNLMDRKLNTIQYIFKTQNITCMLALMGEEHSDEKKLVRPNKGHLRCYFDKPKLKAFLANLRLELDNSLIKNPVSFLLSSKSHAISAAYLPEEKSWVFLNNVPALSITDDDALVDLIFNAYHSAFNDNNFNIEIEFFTAKMDAHLFTSKVEIIRNQLNIPNALTRDMSGLIVIAIAYPIFFIPIMLTMAALSIPLLYSLYIFAAVIACYCISIEGEYREATILGKPDSDVICEKNIESKETLIPATIKKNQCQQINLHIRQNLLDLKTSPSNQSFFHCRERIQASSDTKSKDEIILTRHIARALFDYPTSNFLFFRNEKMNNQLCELINVDQSLIKIRQSLGLLESNGCNLNVFPGTKSIQTLLNKSGRNNPLSLLKEILLIAKKEADMLKTSTSRYQLRSPNAVNLLFFFEHLHECLVIKTNINIENFRAYTVRA